MTLRPLAVAVALVCALVTTPAHARHHKHHKHYRNHVSYSHSDPRPSRWCGWFMRQELGVSDKSYNLARNWACYGTNAHGPAIGAIVVWHHHVGRIIGQTSTGWIVRSGNDGHAVRERVRSLRGAIAFRWPGQFAGM